MPVMDGMEATRRYRTIESASFSASSPKSGTDLRITNIEDSDSSFSPKLGDETVLQTSKDGVSKHVIAATTAAGMVNFTTAAAEYRQREQARCSMSHHRLIIVGMSANPDAGAKGAALAAGMDSFMQKPFTLQEFDSTIQRLNLI